MPTYIVKMEDYYFEYSTIVDAPITWGLKRGDFIEYYTERYGAEGLTERLARVDTYGTSSHLGYDQRALMMFNRAGPNEATISLTNLYKVYCLREQPIKGWEFAQDGWHKHT